MLQISEKFADQCSPVIGSNYDTCGTLTRADMAHLTVAQLNALFTPGGLFADMDAWFLHSIEMKACGTPVVPLYDWIMANADRTYYKEAVQPMKIAGSKSLMHPFVFGLQRSITNKDHWKVTAGYSLAGYTPGVGFPLSAAQETIGDVAVAAGATVRIIRIASRYGIPMEKWFRDGESIHIFNVSGGGVTQHGQWKVLASAPATDLTFVDVVAQSVNAGSAEPYDAAPEDGVLIPGVNNVSDWERWCQNLPTLNDKKKVPFWLQTFRQSRCVDSEYKLIYERLVASNRAFDELFATDVAEMNRQDEVEFQHRFVNSFFFNKPISTNQTLTLWEDLEAIYSVSGDVIDPGLGGKLVGRKANFIGVMEQLRLCGRIKELAGNPLNFYEFLMANKQLLRARRGKDGRTVTDIDWWTDSAYRADLAGSFMDYYKAEYRDMVRINIEVDQLNGKLGIVYDSYFVKNPGGVRINIMSSDYMDDWINEFEDQGIAASGGRRLWALDLGKRGAGTIFWAQTATNKQNHNTAPLADLARLDSTYRCVMKINEIEQQLYSETGTVVVECPLNSLVIQGIGDAATVMTGISGDTLVDQQNLY